MSTLTVSRKLGDSEMSYYIPSREDGVGDMYLRLSVRIHKDIFTTQRLQLAWSILQIRNPLLAARIESNYDTTFANPIPGFESDPKKYISLEAKFVYDIPQSSQHALKRVENHLQVIPNPTEPIRDFLARYLDGARTLSDDLVCKLLLVYAHPEDAEAQFTPPSEEERNPFNPHPIPTIPAHLILLCAHFIGDAGSIQFISKDLMYLLSFPTPELENILEREVKEVMDAVNASGGAAPNDFKGTATLLPASLEGRLPPIRGRFKNVLSKMEFVKWQSRMIGGHSFPKKTTSNPLSFLTNASNTNGTVSNGLMTPPTRFITPALPSTSSPPLSPSRRLPTHTRTHELILSKERTAAILTRCKREGVTISTALFAVVAAAWGEMLARDGESPSMPTLLYSARNMRPYLPAKPPRAVDGSSLKVGKGYKGWESYYYLSLSYFNVILPSWVPAISTQAEGEDNNIPSEEAKKVFWHRARLARKQARGPNPENMADLVRFVSRTWQMGRARREGAEGFAVGALKKIRGIQQAAQKDDQIIKSEQIGLGISLATTANGLTTSNSQLRAPRPSMPSRMPSEMTVPQQFLPSPPLTPRSTNALNTPALSGSPSDMKIELPKVEGKISLSVPRTQSPTSEIVVEKVELDKPKVPPPKVHTHSNPLAASFLPPKVSATALIGLSLLGSFDPLFPPPNQKINHLMPSPESLPTLTEKANGKSPSDYDPSTFAPFEPISLGAGCRLKPGGSLLYAYTYDAQLTIVLGYDTGPLGLVNEPGKGIEGLWEGTVKGIGKWLEEGELDANAIEAGQMLTLSG